MESFLLLLKVSNNFFDLQEFKPRFSQFVTITFLIAISFVNFSSAQVINVETKRFGEIKEGWDGGVQLNFNYFENTRRIYSGGFGSQVQYHRGISTYLVLNQLNLIKINENSVLNKGFHHLRYNYKIEKKISPEFFNQVQFNELQKINLRLLLGGGLRMKVFGDDTLGMFFGAAGMYEHEKEVDTTWIHNDFRLSSYISFKAQVSNVLDFLLTSYYQPLPKNFNDFRIATNASLVFKINGHFKYSTNFSCFYDNFQPVGAKKTTIAFTNALSISF